MTLRLVECRRGDRVRIVRIDAGRGASLNLMNLGLNVGETIELRPELAAARPAARLARPHRGRRRIPPRREDLRREGLTHGPGARRPAVQRQEHHLQRGGRLQVGVDQRARVDERARARRARSRGRAARRHRPARHLLAASLRRRRRPGRRAHPRCAGGHGADQRHRRLGALPQPRADAAADRAAAADGGRAQHDRRGPAQGREHRRGESSPGLLGVPVVEAIGRKGEGVPELFRAARGPGASIWCRRWCRARCTSSGC